jgi:MFS family permease
VASSLRRNRNFTLLWIGQALSDVGSGASSLAYPLLVLAVSHSAVLAGTVGSVAAVVGVMGRLPAGALADRYDRRRTMLICDAVRGVVMGVVVAAVLTHHIGWPAIVVVASIDALGDGVFFAAGSALLPMLVPEDAIETAWAATQARGQAASIAGPPLGGALFGFAQALPFLADAVSYVASVATIAALRGRTRPALATQRRSMRRELREAAHLIWRTPVMRAFVLQAPLINFAFAGVAFSVPVDLRLNGVRPSVIGAVMAALAASALVGAVLSARIARRFRLGTLIIGMATSSTILFTISAIVVPSPLVALPLVAVGALAPAANTALLSRMARIVPEGSMGRVVSIMQFSGQALGVFAPLIGGVLVARHGGHVALGVFALAEVAALVMAVIQWPAWNSAP